MSFKIWLESLFDKKLIDQIGPHRIYSVNASKIRNKSVADDGFNHFATHLEFPSIVPKNEIWVSQDIDKKETPFLITNGLNQYKAQKKGVKDPYDYALRREKKEREAVDGIKFQPKEKPPENLYYKLFCKIKSDGIQVWLVDGEKVRDIYKSDFIEGGNNAGAGKGVYPWIPKDEIWIEKNLKEKGEIEITILHEYVERTLMRKMNFSYGKAHGIATKIDFKHRGKFTKQDAENLTEKEALEMAKSYLK